MKKLMYFRVQEKHLDTGTQYRETMSSELLQQKTSSVQYYISTKQAITFLREKKKKPQPQNHSVPLADAKSSREEGSKDLARHKKKKKFLPLASLGYWQDSN